MAVAVEQSVESMPEADPQAGTAYVQNQAMTTSAPSRRPVARAGDLQLEVAEAESRWTAACASSGEHVTAFHTWSWLHAGAAMTAGDFVPLVVVRAGTDIGVVPMVVRRRGPFVTLDCVPFPYCGPLVPRTAQAGCFDLVKSYARRRRALRTVIQFPPGADLDERALSARGFVVGHDASYVLDTTAGTDALWSGLTGEARRRVRHTEKHGTTLCHESPGQALDTFQDLTFDQRGLHSGYVGRFSEHFHLVGGPDLRVHQATAVRDGEVLGVLITMASATEALGWMGGVFPQHRATHAGYLLYWDAIRWASEIGVERIDLVGVVNEGIGQFKKQFGGTLTPYVSAQLDSRLASLTYRVHGRLTHRADRESPKR